MNMSPEDICDLFDRKPDLSLAALARITGWTVEELKTLLLGWED